jgi:hypothetical protein
VAIGPKACIFGHCLAVTRTSEIIRCPFDRLHDAGGREEADRESDVRLAGCLQFADVSATRMERIART